MKLLKVLIIIIFVLAICIGAPYLYISVPKTVDTEYSDADYSALIKKIGLEENLNLEDENKVGIVNLINGSFSDSGTKTLTNIVITDSEIAAFVNNVVKSDVINNFNIAFHDGYVAMSFNIGNNVESLVEVFPAAKPYEDYIKLAAGKPVYWELTLEKASEKSFTSVTKAIYIGQLELPDDKLNQGLSALGTTANDIVGDFQNFKVDELSFSEAGMNFSGTIPTSVNPIK